VEVRILTATDSASEIADSAPSPSLIPPRLLVLIRRAATAAWVGGLVLWTLVKGIALDRTQLLVIICSGLVAASIGRHRALGVIRDWLPFATLLFVYDLSRGAAALLGRPTEWHLQGDFDRALFGIEPTVWLQSHLKQATPPWWEVGVSVVYMSFFVTPYAVAGVLWLRNRADWRKFVLRFLTVAFIGLAGFVAFPAAPPWAASQCTLADVARGPADPGCIYAAAGSAPDGGLLGVVQPHNSGAAPQIERISSRGWDRLGLTQAQTLVDEGQAGVNLVAAVPSLHAAISALVAVFVWPRVRRRWRPLVAAYPLVMAFALVYSAEHYVFDILVGWAVTGLVSAAFSWRERRSRAFVMGEEIQLGPADTLDGPLLARN
jgi:hypothetical protein